MKNIKEGLKTLAKSFKGNENLAIPTPKEYAEKMQKLSKQNKNYDELLDNY